MPREPNVTKSGERFSVSVSGKAFSRLTAKMRRDHKGRVIGAGAAVDAAINAAIDAETKAN